MARYDSILDTIGNTPLVRLNKLAPAGVIDRAARPVEHHHPLVLPHRALAGGVVAPHLQLDQAPGDGAEPHARQRQQDDRSSPAHGTSSPYNTV